MADLTPAKVPQEQFRNAVMVMRNRYIPVALQPLFTLRAEVVANDELLNRGGTDTPTKSHFLTHLIRCDAMRRRVTHNPASIPLDILKMQAADVNLVSDKSIAGSLDSELAPFGGDQIQNQSGALIDISLMYSLDGTDPNIPLMSQLNTLFRTTAGGLILQAIDDAIVSWTRLNSNMRSTHITIEDSIRILGKYQAVYDFVRSFTGDDNRIDVAQMLPTQEPRGPQASPNLVIENTGVNASGT